jgi:hypothetical protein
VAGRIFVNDEIFKMPTARFGSNGNHLAGIGFEKDIAAWFQDGNRAIQNTADEHQAVPPSVEGDGRFEILDLGGKFGNIARFNVGRLKLEYQSRTRAFAMGVNNAPSRNST